MRWLRYIVSTISFLFLILLLFSLLPAPRQRIENVKMPFANVGSEVIVSFDYPERLWLETSDTLNLTTRLEADTEAEQSLPPEIAMEVTLDSRCLQFDPPGDSLQAIMTDTTQRWRWELNPVGPPTSCDLTLVVGLPQANASDKQVIYVRKLTIETMSFAGLPVTTVRMAGFTGSIAGILIFAYIQIRSIRARRKLKT